MSPTVSLSAASEGSKEEELPPTGQGLSFQHSSVPPPRSPVDPTVSHTWVAAAGPRARGARLTGGPGAARRPEHPRCLPCWPPSGAGSVARSPGKAGWRREVAGALCRSGLTAPGTRHLSSPRLVLPARRAPAGVSRAPHPGLMHPAARPAGLGLCCCEFGQAGVPGSEAGGAPPNLHPPQTGDPGKWPVGGGALPVAWVAAFY